jgi:hypothetical protein
MRGFRSKILTGESEPSFVKNSLRRDLEAQTSLSNDQSEAGPHKRPQRPTMLTLHDTHMRAHKVFVAMAAINITGTKQEMPECKAVEVPAAPPPPQPTSCKDKAAYVKPLDRIAAAAQSRSPKATSSSAPSRISRQDAMRHHNRKDALKPGNPGTELYFEIRRACTAENDDVRTLRMLLPARETKGRDFAVWPRQHLLLHGLSKAGCVECVKYLVNTLKFDVNYPRATDKCTALHMAHFHLQGKALQAMRKTLLALKAKPYLKNKWGELPADLVAKPGVVEPSPKMLPASPQQSPCGVADMWLEAPKLTALTLGPSASSSKSKSAVPPSLSPLPEGCADSPSFVPKGDVIYQSYCLGKDIALDPRDPRACAWKPAAAAISAGTPAGDLYLAVRRAAGAVLPAHNAAVAAR